MAVAVYDGKTATELADQASEAVRGINHVTLGRDGLEFPSEAYRVLASLAELAGRLPQALGQLDRQLSRWLETGQLVVDGGMFAGDPIAAYAAAAVYLEQGQVAAEQLRSALDTAQQATAHLGMPDDDPVAGDAGVDER